MTKSKEAKFNKEQIINSVSLSFMDKDILKTILKEDGQYSVKEVEKALRNFKRKEIK